MFRKSIYKYYPVLQPDSILRDVFTRGCSTMGIVDTNLFGLAVYTGMFFFLLIDSRISGTYSPCFVLRR